MKKEIYGSPSSKWEMDTRALSAYTKLTCITDGPTQRLLLTALAVSLATMLPSFSPSRATEHTCDVRLLAISSGQLVSLLETHVPIHTVVAQLIV